MPLSQIMRSPALMPRGFAAAALILLCGCATTHAPSVAELRASAEDGDTSAQVDLGDAYASGRGVAQSYAEAARWYARAADGDYLRPTAATSQVKDNDGDYRALAAASSAAAGSSSAVQSALTQLKTGG